MNDVLGHIMLAERNENLLAENTVPIAFGNGPRANLCEIRAGLRFGKAHRARPGSLHQFWNVELLLLVRSHQFDRFDCALVEQRAVGKPDIRCVPHLQRRAEHQRGQPLATIFGRYRQTNPSGFCELRVGFFEAGRRGDVSVFPRAAFLIAGLIDRIEHLARECRRFLEDRFRHVEHVLVAGQVGHSLQAGKFAKDELHVAQRRLIATHRLVFSRLTSDGMRRFFCVALVEFAAQALDGIREHLKVGQHIDFDSPQPLLTRRRDAIEPA